MKTSEFNVRDSKTVSNKSLMSEGEQQLLISLFMCEVTEYIKHYHNHLIVQIVREDIVVQGITNSTELEFLECLISTDLFSRDYSARTKTYVLKYNGEEDKRLVAWTTMSAAVRMLKEQFADEYNSKMFINDSTNCTLQSWMQSCKALLGLN